MMTILTSSASAKVPSPSSSAATAETSVSKPRVMVRSTNGNDHEDDTDETASGATNSGLVEMAKRPSRKIPQHDEDDEQYHGNNNNNEEQDNNNRKTSPATSTARDKLFRFFYPRRQPEYLGNSSVRGRRAVAKAVAAAAATTNTGSDGDDPLEPPPTHEEQQQPSRSNPIRTPSFLLNDIDDPDIRFVHRFWTTYDDILILSIFTQLGILFRLAVATWFTFFDGVFSNESPLFVNLPLNCLSCWIMGVLCSGEQLMSIITTRFTPPRTQQSIYHYHDDEEGQDNDTNAIAVPGMDDEDDEDIDDLQLEAGIMKVDERDYDYDDDDDPEQSYEGFDYNEQRPRRGLRNRRGRLPLRRRRRRQRHRRKRDRDDQSYFHFWQPPVHLNEELRDVQLLALERRIRLSKCLVLFPVKNEDVDVMEHYFNHGYKKSRTEYDDDAERAVVRKQKRKQKHISFADTELNDLVLTEHCQDVPSSVPSSLTRTRSKKTSSTNPSSKPPPKEKSASLADSALSPPSATTNARVENVDTLMGTIQSPPTASNQKNDSQRERDSLAHSATGRPAADTSNATQPLSPDVSSEEDDDEEENDDDSTSSQAEEDPDYFADLTNTVQENVDRLSRVNLADGWDAGTTPEAMSDDLLLGLRDGFCGALSSFSSWNAAMAGLMRKGEIGDAFVGYMIGLQLPIIAYRFGQHVAVFIFVWRTRRETRIAERRGGYGIRVSINEESERDPSEESDDEQKKESQLPSIRAVVTAVFILALISQISLLTFFESPHYQQAILSLLFSPLGVFARWRLSKLNQRRPTFPLGTFTANLLACSLSGSLGTLLAGNPGPKQRIVLVSFIDGFGGTLSSLASFVIEILAGIDPILFRFDGVFYAVVSLSCAWAIGFVFSGSVQWADRTTVASNSIVVDENDGNRTLNEMFN